jgi:hypothetical protein
MVRTLLPSGLLVALLSPSAVHALRTESLGNSPIGAGWGFDNTVLELINTEARVYWYEVNGNPFFYFKGTPRDLNNALRRFAALSAEKKEIILLPGPGEWQTFDHKPVAFDWSVHVPMGLKFDGDSEVADTRATLTIHISARRPPALADPAKARRWIADLGSDDFKTREVAAKELAALGPPVAELLRDSLKGAASAEAGDRLERVLATVSVGLSLDVLNLPDDIPIIDLETLLARCRKALSDESHHARGVAASALSHRSATAEEVLPDLERVLKNEKHEYPLRCAAGSASRLGAVGKPLLPALRAAMKTDDMAVKAAMEYAIDAIEKAKEVKVADAEAKSRAEIRKEIREFVEARAVKKGK